MAARKSKRKPIPMVRHPTMRANFCIVSVNAVEYAFSYHECIGYRIEGGKWVVRTNEWGPTTGQHLNALDGGGAAQEHRLTGEDFIKSLP